jgi:anti-sigma factor RsiW
MTDQLSNCERWQEPISLLAAGCLPAEDEAGVRRHLDHCAACAAVLAELTAVCASLSRSRPSAAVHAAAICERWSEAAEDVLPCRPGRRTPPRVLWLSAALAASLLIAAVWLVQRQPGGSPSGPQESRVAAGGAPSGAEQAPLPPELPPPVENVPVERVWSQPTLRAYELALAQSDEAFEALLQRHGESIVFEPYNAQSLFQESYP